jgi:Uma2 family endonuclease
MGKAAEICRTPPSGDILLLIEVADSSLNTDRDEKGKLYATAGVMEYWIVNLIDRTVEVHRDPKKGRYQNVQSVDAGASVQPLAIAEVRLSVDSLFGSLA